MSHSGNTNTHTNKLLWNARQANKYNFHVYSMCVWWMCMYLCTTCWKPNRNQIERKRRKGQIRVKNNAREKEMCIYMYFRWSIRGNGNEATMIKCFHANGTKWLVDCLTWLKYALYIQCWCVCVCSVKHFLVHLIVLSFFFGRFSFASRTLHCTAQNFSAASNRMNLLMSHQLNVLWNRFQFIRK